MLQAIVELDRHNSTQIEHVEFRRGAIDEDEGPNLQPKKLKRTFITKGLDMDKATQTESFESLIERVANNAANKAADRVIERYEDIMASRELARDRASSMSPQMAEAYTNMFGMRSPQAMVRSPGMRDLLK